MNEPPGGEQGGFARRVGVIVLLTKYCVERSTVLWEADKPAGHARTRSTGGVAGSSTSADSLAGHGAMPSSWAALPGSQQRTASATDGRVRAHAGGIAEPSWPRAALQEAQGWQRCCSAPPQRAPPSLLPPVSHRPRQGPGDTAGTAQGRGEPGEEPA